MIQFNGPPQTPEVTGEQMSRRKFIKTTGAAVLGGALVGDINIEEKQSREQRKLEYIALARELSESQESFPFPGIDPESYSELKAVAEEFPEHSTPIDELIARFTTQGMRVVLSEGDPDSGNVFVVPLGSRDVEMDSLFPRHLILTKGVDERLRRLIATNKDMKG